MMKNQLVRILLVQCTMAALACHPSRSRDTPTAPESASPRDEELTVTQKIWVEPVLAQLSVSFAHDEQVLDLLERAEVGVKHKGRHAKSGAAVAYNEGETPRVEIDLEYLDASLEYCATSTYLALLEPGAALRVAVYAQELARKAGRTSSRRRLSKQIPIDEWLEYDPVRIGLFDGLFSTTCFDVTAWVILHEVGHHALGHMTSPSSPNSQRREELDADRWALDAMRRAGMTTFYVGSYLAARDTFERAEHEVVGEPEGSLYPTWGERLAAYEKRISADGELEGLLGRNGMTMTLFPFAPTEDSTRFGLVIIPFGMKEGEIKIVALGTILASVFQFEHQSFLPAIRRDGAIRVFERSGPESTIVELAFADDGYTLTDMTVRVRPSPDAMVQENEGSAWQTNGSSVLYGVHMDGNPAWALGHEVKLEHAMMSGLSPRDAEEFIASMEEIQQLRLRPLLDFHEGKLSLEELRTEAKRTKEVAIERQAAVRAKVGDHVWMRFFELQSPKGELGKCIVDRDFAECSEEFDEAFEKSIGVRD